LYYIQLNRTFAYYETEHYYKQLLERIIVHNAGFIFPQIKNTIIMKKIISLAFLGTLLCSFISPLSAQSLPLQKYYAGLSILPPNELLSITKAQNLYFRTFNNVTPSTCDSGYVLFEDFLIIALDSIDFELPFKAKDERYLNKLKLAGLRVVDNGRLVTVKPDMDYFMSGFRPYFSADMRKYFDKVENEDKTGFIENDSLTVPFTELAKRVLFWDNFSSSGFALAEEARQRRERYLNALIFGEPLSPIWNVDGTLRSDVRSALETLQREADTNTIGSLKQIVDRYLQVLQSCNYSKCNKAAAYTL
jgi:hypothetical protein